MDREVFNGVWEIESYNVMTGVTEKVTFKNKVVQGFYDKLHSFFNNDQEGVSTVDDLNLNYVGLGVDSTSVSRADTTLYDEEERKSYTTKTYTDSAFRVRLFLGLEDGNLTGGYIKEIGVFANATSTLNSGTMISRAVVNIQKNDNIQLTLTWTFSGESN